MRTLPRTPEPREVFAIHQERISGLSPAQIGVKHDLSPMVVQSLLRPRPNTTLPTPFELSQASIDGTAAVSLYWLGFITGCGRVSEGVGSRTLVLSIDPRDVEHTRVLVRDLIRNHASYEFCMSSRDGQQLYIRERDLGDAAAQWGLTDEPRETRFALEYVPANLLPHFTRGILEGQLDQPPFGGREKGREPSAQASRVAFQGSRSFAEELQRRLKSVASGDIQAIDLHQKREASGAVHSSGAVLVYQGDSASSVLRYAYSASPRFSPRGTRLVKAFTAS
jgi:hypothetical protein